MEKNKALTATNTIGSKRETAVFSVPLALLARPPTPLTLRSSHLLALSRLLERWRRSPDTGQDTSFRTGPPAHLLRSTETIRRWADG